MRYHCRYVGKIPATTVLYRESARHPDAFRLPQEWTAALQEAGMRIPLGEAVREARRHGIRDATTRASIQCYVARIGTLLGVQRVRVEGGDLDVKMLLPEPSSVIAAVLEGLGVSLCSEIIAKKAERAGLIGIVHQNDAKGVEYFICVRRREGSQDDTLSQFWDYLVNASKRFKGNLPCMLKILYL